MWLRGAGKGKSTGRPELLEKSKEKSIHRYIDLRDNSSDSVHIIQQIQHDLLRPPPEMHPASGLC
ncbi:hypothetical protein F9C07_8552 [Aspergillus flavus]|uniref:Uncharacterized protein n=1 Tax=Aspergillus flavus (strain ATCC 200026 / FGSC A1120 / IAM 13836 / NRRL 3357 / JCM 12722 / SRRC 167) TaxID=332952 RepID=A0A7U2N311_ASPFN|nr:hypothetical protein F9C07_8552 [Aspergillus flavus]